MILEEFITTVSTEITQENAKKSINLTKEEKTLKTKH